jgi:polar amino acid transport system permease protein
MNEFVRALGVLATGIGNTFLLTGASFVLGAVIAVPVVLCRVSPLTPLRVIATSYTELSRGVPPIVWLFLIYFGLTQFDLRLESMTAAVVGLGIISGGYMAEIYRSGLRAVPAGKTEATHALGIPRVATYTKVIVPQAVRIVLPPLIGWTIVFFQATSLAYAVSIPELLSSAYAIAASNFKYLFALGLAAALYAAISIPSSLLVDHLERRQADQP